MAPDADFKNIWLVCLWMQVVWSLDEVVLLNPPEEPLPDYLLQILYSCDEPAAVQLDCIVSFEIGTVSTFLLRNWSCVPGERVIKTTRLNLPDWLVYQADGVVPDSQWVLSCILRASVRSRGLSDSERSIRAQDVASVQPKPFFSRPCKRHKLCFAWCKQMLQLTPKFLQRQCPFEQETVQILTTIFASTGENFGVTKTLEPFRNEFLEYVRLKNNLFPWCMISFWIFLTSHCKQNLCGLFYHIDSQNNYVTPTVLLKQTGHLHIQMNGESEESSAFLSLFTVPLNQWCQISLMLEGRKVKVSMACLNRTIQVSEHVFGHAILFDDTEGYFVVGGGKFIQGAEGYFGPVVYNRNKISAQKQSETVIPDVIKSLNLTGWLQSCQEFREEMVTKIKGFLLKKKQRIETGFDISHPWMGKKELPPNSQCEPWEKTAPHRKKAVDLAMLLVFKYGEKVSLEAVSKALYSLSVQRLSRASSIAVVSRMLPLLLQAGCLGDNGALHMSSVLYSAGLGVQKQPVKAWLLALLAAQKDDRLALLHLGYMHHQGRHGLPKDPDLAYAYYSNIAKQTTLDRHNHTLQQSFVEAVYLNNEEALNLQTREDHHIFQWLKHQAQRGAADAEQTIARMLFWGQQGLSPNIQEAVKHYRRGAVQLEDPVSMYDYGIVLLQGHGVDKDIQKGLTFLKKSMDQGFVPAITALAWYYEQYEHDYRKAVQLWEKADLLGCPDAALNLGVIHSLGLFPGKPASQYMAYTYYLKSANRGQIRGAVHLAEVWATGIPGNVTRRPSDAVLWVKWAAEQNGYLGRILRKALDSYLLSDMFSSLLYYVIAAESGYAPAQFNVAYLCEQNAGRFLDPAFAKHCMWTYYNFTIQSENSDTYALIRMGDLLYEGHGSRGRDLFFAAQMYTQAALKGNPQGWYSLGLLAEDVYRLPLSILSKLGLSKLYMADNSLLQTALFQRCRDSDIADSYLPCSLALFKVFLQSFQKEYSDSFKFLAAVAVVAGPTVLVIIGALRRRVLSLN
ncbi:protein sel-1 homolog 3 isoform X3 [Oryzias latipes]|uniref:protein sel-1 homolog 3 isoform X3 n=1 Tax=Oryzias latipes TaxID=8090 RepID=UPI0009DA0694|nr:protein sel-1 homolog 3 isoform X3 [Oryzias latipes]